MGNGGQRVMGNLDGYVLLGAMGIGYGRPEVHGES